MSALVNYNVEARQSSLPLDVEYAADPASGSFFNSDFKKHEDLKQMLDSNKDGLKLEAMKRIIGMLAKGKDASELFPAVVKNVVSANLEVKKLVYVYLVRYAEEQQDLALLSISTFQRGLKDPNPLIRACALRVLSSIRVQVIVPIMLLAIKETVTDLSPYVRKTTAHAIPKLYSLDPEQKEELIKVIEKLLSDMSTLVVGSAVMAFEEVCPERIDLIHTNYKKLCCLLVDVEEWGQVIIINMLTRYARTQFVDPNLGESDDPSKEAPFYDDNSYIKEEIRKMDPDHRLLLANTKPLLQSRNAAVVMSVAQLYQHIAPHGEVNQVARALVRLLRSHREVQAVVLTNIATLSTQRKGMFEPFLKSFFVRSSDPTHIKVLKLEVITNLAMESNIAVILREFQTYIWSADKEFVAATIQAIGRCASNIKEVTDSCLNGLVMLLSNKDESIVGESVVVVRKLLQSETVGHKDIITHMARLVDNIKMSTARASILWLLGEYCDKVPKLAPDVLRKMAKSFVNEADVVKLQIITLATKLYLTNPKQTHLLCQYVFNLAKYDMNYDIRDRARFVRAIIFPVSKENMGKLSRQAKKIFLSSKPPPVQHSNFKDRDLYQLGTLSHMINARANGYCDLPSFPEVAPDPSVRAQPEEEPPAWNVSRKPHAKKASSSSSSFYSADEEESEDEDEEDSSEEDDSDSEGDSTSSSGDEEEEAETSSGTSSSSSSTSSDVSYSEDDSEEEKNPSSSSAHPRPSEDKVNGSTGPGNFSLDLLDLSNDLAPAEVDAPVMTPSGDSYTPGASIKPAKPMYVAALATEALNRLDAAGGLSVLTRFTRASHLYSASMTSVELTFKNEGESELRDVCVGSKRLAPGSSMHDFGVIASVSPGATIHVTVGIDFNDSITPASFDVVAGGKRFPVTITPVVGDLINAVFMSERDFTHFQAKLRGLNEHSGMIKIPPHLKNTQLLIEKIYQYVNVLQVPSTEDQILKFAGETSSSKCVVLISIHEGSGENEEEMKVTVNCEKMMLGSILLKCLEDAFAKETNLP